MEVLLYRNASIVFHCTYKSDIDTVSDADDDNRIILEPMSDIQNCQGDYINACYVDVSKSMFM